MLLSFSWAIQVWFIYKFCSNSKMLLSSSWAILTRAFLSSQVPLCFLCLSLFINVIFSEYSFFHIASWFINSWLHLVEVRFEHEASVTLRCPGWNLLWNLISGGCGIRMSWVEILCKINWWVEGSLLETWEYFLWFLSL